MIDLNNPPMLGGNVSLWDNLLYKSEFKNTDCHYLILDEENQHYHSINNIKGFLACEEFCPKCMKGFYKKEGYEQHECETGYTKKVIVDKRNEEKC